MAPVFPLTPRQNSGMGLRIMRYPGGNDWWLALIDQTRPADHGDLLCAADESETDPAGLSFEICIVQPPIKLLNWTRHRYWSKNRSTRKSVSSLWMTTR